MGKIVPVLAFQTVTDSQTDCLHTYMFSRNSGASNREHAIKFKKLFNPILKSLPIDDTDTHDGRLYSAACILLLLGVLLTWLK
jgi:hypothetical protein